MTEVIMDDAPMYGEVVFARNRMQKQIDDLEEQLTQANRLHEGLVKDKEESWEAKNNDLQRRLDAERDRCRTLEKYVGVIRHAWKEITTEEFPKMGGWKLDPEVDPTSFGYIFEGGQYTKVSDMEYTAAGHMFVSDGKGMLHTTGSALDSTELTVAAPTDLILEDE